MMSHLLDGLGLTLVGAVVGAFIGLTGLGGGALVVPVLVLLYKLDQTTAQGTSLSIILSPLQAPAIWKYASEGKLDWRFLYWMAPGVLVGSFIGASVAVAIPKDLLRTIFGLTLVYVGAYSCLSMLGIGRSVLLALLVTLFAGLVLAGGVWWDGRAGGAPPGDVG